MESGSELFLLFRVRHTSILVGLCCFVRFGLEAGGGVGSGELWILGRGGEEGGEMGNRKGFGVVEGLLWGVPDERGAGWEISTARLSCLISKKQVLTILLS